MFEATKATTKAELWIETQGYVNRIHSTVRTRLSSLNHRVNSLESELGFKAKVVQVLESRIAELERRSLLQPDRLGDLQHVGDQPEPGPSAQVQHLPAIEDDGRVQPSPQEDGEASPSDQENGEAAPVPQEGGVAAPLPQEGGEAAPVPREGGEAAPLPQEGGEAAPVPQEGGEVAPLPREDGEAALVPQEDGEAASLSQEDGEAAPSSDEPSSAEHGAAGGRRTAPSNPNARPGPGAGISCSSERKSSLGQASAYNTVDYPGQPLNLSATPTRVIRRVRDEVEATEARILNLSTRGGPANHQ